MVSILVMFELNAVTGGLIQFYSCLFSFFEKVDLLILPSLVDF